MASFSEEQRAELRAIMHEAIAPLRTDIIELKADVAVLKADVAGKPPV